MNLLIMSTAPAINRKPMKTRDKIKYLFATFLGVMTVIAIGGLLLARYHREQTTVQEEMHIHQTISTFGQNGAIPEKIELPDSPPATGAGTL